MLGVQLNHPPQLIFGCLTAEPTDFFAVLSFLNSGSADLLFPAPVPGLSPAVTGELDCPVHHPKELLPA